ncbi:MAG: hypothetical protein I4O49_22915 [Janthinobacterium lividum]|nr:hypothetical protein [Janthinobacterium lividum]
MKRVMMLMGFVLAGFVTAAIVIRIMTAFDNNPGCGLDCASPELEAALLLGLATVLAFPILGFFFTRKRNSTTRRIAATLSTLMLVAILLAFVHYVFNLHTRYLRAEAARPVQPDLDFMYMAIATRDVQTYTELKKGQPQSVGMIAQWQRCAIGGASCGKQPRQAHMLCKSGEVFVNETDWKYFSLIPKENVFGAIPLKSMKLCAPDNWVEPLGRSGLIGSIKQKPRQPAGSPKSF